MPGISQTVTHGLEYSLWGSVEIETDDGGEVVVCRARGQGDDDFASDLCESQRFTIRQRVGTHDLVGECGRFKCRSWPCEKIPY